MDSQFDQLAGDYARMAAENPVRLHSERHTLLRVLGDLRGRDVLDIGCGEGQYTRLLRARGAARVTGVDVSEGMLEHARQRERRERRGLRYLRRDAGRPPDTADPELDGAFDVAVGVYLFPYASTARELTGMCRTARRSLKPQGGRFVTATLNPDVSTTPGWYDHYGYEVLDTAGAGAAEATTADGSPFRVRIRVGAGSVTLDAHRWSLAAHERALREAGFDRVAWVRPGVSDQGRGLYADTYWQNYLARPQLLIADCSAGPASCHSAPADTDPPEGTA